MRNSDGFVSGLLIGAWVAAFGTLGVLSLKNPTNLVSIDDAKLADVLCIASGGASTVYKKDKNIVVACKQEGIKIESPDFKSLEKEINKKGAL